MVAITIRNVPDEIRDSLAARAKRVGQSMQEYLLSELAELAARKTVNSWLDDVRAHVEANGTRLDTDTIVRFLREDRDDPDR
jgi:plasmid stability protein